MVNLEFYTQQKYPSIKIFLDRQYFKNFLNAISQAPFLKKVLGNVHYWNKGSKMKEQQRVKKAERG